MTNRATWAVQADRNDGVQTFVWTAAHVAAIKAGAQTDMPRFDPVERILPGIDLWDHWPIIDRLGRTVDFDGRRLIIGLTAPVLDDPDERHAIARLSLLSQGPEGWRDHGHLLPDGFTRGSREWAGTAVLEADGRTLALYYTSAGEAGEAAPSFVQRMWLTHGTLVRDHGAPHVRDWGIPQELVRPDDVIYQADMAGGGAVGTIKAFRDPFPLIDPESGIEYLFFSASRAGADSLWNGLVGMARRAGDGWVLMPPLVDATGVNNELERPHIVAHDGLFYLFWSTQAKVFAADGPRGPTGLYGLVAERITGPWRPMNGTALVLANPQSAPFQAYSWLVLDDLSVWSFADLPGLAHAPRDSAEARKAFSGSPAPVARLSIAGDRSRVLG